MGRILFYPYSKLSQSTSWSTPQSDLSSEKKSCSHHGINRLEESEKLLWYPGCSAETPNNVEGPWFPPEYVMKRNWVTDPCAPVSLQHKLALRGHHQSGAPSLQLLLWIFPDYRGYLRKTSFLELLFKLHVWPWEKLPYLSLKQNSLQHHLKIWHEANWRS